MSKRKSEVWNYLQKVNTNEAKCNQCGRILSCKGSSTTGLINHLKLHDLNISRNSSCNDIDSEPSTSKTMKLSNSSIKSFFKCQISLSEILAKCAAKDGFTFNAMVNSEAIRGYVTSRNFNMPRSCTSIQKHVLKFFEEKKQETKTELIRILHSKKKFSIAVDEWTDVLMRRFLNVTLRSSNSKEYVLGLVAIKEKCTAEKTKELVENVLKEFGINLETDIVASTNDGASVMVKYCSLIAAEKQLCYNHAIHLAVLKILYKKVNSDAVVEDEDKTEYDDEEILYDEDNQDEENQNEENQNEDDGTLVMEIEQNSECYLLVSDIKPALYAMRKLIKFFKNSSVRTEILLKHVLQKEGKNLKLILDVRTRWNTLASAINRFLKLIECINNALDELGLQNFDENYLHVLKSISITLEPTVLAVQELGKKDANLITAEGTIIYVMKKLKDIDTELSLKLLETLKNEIEKRRNRVMVSLLIFLHQGTYVKQNENEFLNYSSKSSLKIYARQLFLRLFPQNEIENRVAEDLETEIFELEEDELTEYENLQNCIRNLTKSKKAKNNEFNIDKEFKNIEGNGGKRSDNMDSLYDALLTVSPTSTSCERVFSVSGNKMTKIRSRLGIDTLNALNDESIKKKCSIEEFAIFFLNLVRNQTDDFQRGNTSSQCNTPGNLQSEGFVDNDIAASNVILESEPNQISASSSKATQYAKTTHISLPQQQQTPPSPSLSKSDSKNSTNTKLTIKNLSTSSPINLTNTQIYQSFSNSGLITDPGITIPTIINQNHSENLSQTGELFSGIGGNKLLASHWQHHQKKFHNNSLTNNPIVFDENSFKDSLQLKSSSPINQQQQQQQQQKNLKKSLQHHNNDYYNNITNVPGIIYIPQQQNYNEDLILSSGRYTTPNRSFENHFKSNTSTAIRKYNRSNDNNISTVSNISSSGGNVGGSGNKNRNTSFCLGDFILPSSSSLSPSSNQTRQKNRNNKNSKDAQSTSMTLVSAPMTTEFQNRSAINNSNNSGLLSQNLTLGKTSTMNTKPKKRVQPTPVIQTHDGNLSSSSVFTRPAFGMENNILNISKEEILDKSNCQILKERVKLKTEKNAIAKEFESQSIAGKQNHLNLKYIQENITTQPSVLPSISRNDNNFNKCQSVGEISTSTQNRIKRKIDFTKITNRHALNRFIEIHSALIELNLTTNILNEMSYLLNFLNYTDFDDFTNIVVATDATLPIELNKINNNTDGGHSNITMTTSSCSNHNSKRQDCTVKEKQVSSSSSSSSVVVKEDITTTVNVNFEDDTQIDPKLINHIDDSICNFTGCNKLYTILKNFLNCLYYARGVLDKQKHLLALLDVTTLRVVLDNEHLDNFNKDLKIYLNSIYQHKIKLDSMKSNHETSFKICSSIQQTVFYQQENDTKNNFPSEREFLAFKKQRDMFYVILKNWETKHLNHTWNFHLELGPKIQNLLNVMENPINMAHLAKLFTSQLIISSNFSESPSDLEINLPNIDLSKLSKLRQRLVAPSHFSVDYQFPGNQVFFKDFLLTANSVVFAEQLKITIIAELIEMNNSSYEVINLSNDNNMEVDNINDDNDNDNQQYNEYVVRPEIISTMRVLSKFLGLLMSRSFNYQGNRNSLVDNRQIELRDMLQPEFDLIKILEKSIIDRKLIVTIPWLVQYLSMLDHVTLKLSYYRQLIQQLYKLYMNMIFYHNNYDNLSTFQYNINLHMRPTSIFILRTCLGWLFDNLNISEGYYQYRQQIFQSIDSQMKIIPKYNEIIDKSKKILKQNSMIDDTTGIKDNNDKMQQIIINIPSNLCNEFNENNENYLMIDLKKYDNEYHCKLVKVSSNSLDSIEDYNKNVQSPTKTERSLIYSDRITDVNQGQDNNMISINKSFDPLLEGILNVSCPFLADFRVAIMPIKSSKCVSRTGRYRHITTKISGQIINSDDNKDENCDISKNCIIKDKQNSDTQTKLIEAFFHSQSLSVRRIVEFVIERTTSAVIKDYQMEILLPSKSNAMDKINEINSTELKTITNEMYKIFSYIYNETMLKWDIEIPKMIENRVKKSLDALLPNETLDAVKKTCLEIIRKKCQFKANEWRLTNLNGLEFYSKDIPSDAEKLLKNNSIKKIEQLPATILDIDMSKPLMSIVYSKLQFSLHFTNQRPELVNENDLLILCDELFITLNSHKLPTSFFRVTGVMTVCLVQNLILRHNNILTNHLIDKFIKIWQCNGLKNFIQLPNFENDEMIVIKSDKNNSNNFEDTTTIDSVNIFNGILSESYLQLILQNSELYEKYSEILIILLNNKLLNINYLNNKFIILFKLDWKQDEYKKLKIILETITRKTQQQIQSNENDIKSILFMEMLTDLISDIDEF